MGGRYVPKSNNRAKQLWITGTLGSPRQWQPNEQTWRRLERAYGCNFDNSLRSNIEGAVQRYLDWVGAPTANDFLDKLNKARKRARELREIVVSFGEASILVAPHWARYFPTDDIEQSDALLGDDDASLFEWACSMKSLRRGRDHRCFDEVLYTVCSALDDLWLEVSRHGEGATTPSLTWDHLVLDLGRAFKRKSLKVTASKRGDGLSPFVRFVGQLQKALPRAPWLHSTDAALSQAVYQALNPEKKKAKRGGTGSRRRGKHLPQLRSKRL